MSKYYPTSDDISLLVSRGLVTKTTFIHKFGAVPSMSQNTLGTVWDKNDTVYPWSIWDTAGVINIDAASLSDVGKTITVVGLNDNYEPLQENITLSVQNNNLSVNEFKRVYRAYVSDGVSNVGNITIQKNSTDVALILTGKSQTLMSIYTIPARHTGYLYKGTCSAQAGADGTGDMFVRYFGQSSFRVGHSFEVSGTGGQYVYDFTFPIPIPEKSDIDVRLLTRTNNGRFTAAFDLLIIDNEAAT